MALPLSRVVSAQPPGPPRSLTLEGALAIASQNSPLMRAARVRIREAQGDLTGASMLLRDNPVIAASAGPRLSAQEGQDPTLDLDVGIQQQFEIGGQRGDRIDRARADIEAARASTEDVQRVIDLAVAVAFYETLGNRQRLELLDQNEQLARDLHQAAQRRLEAGEGTPLELNTARIRLAEARRQTIAARTALRSSSVRLAEILGLSPGTELSLSGELPTQQSAPSMEALLARARRSRPDLVAAERRVEAARAAIDLANAEAWPDITVGVFYGQEEGDQTITARLRVPIPLFNRNQGARERARAVRDRRIAERDAVELTVASDLRQALLAYEQAREALALYDAEVLAAQSESLELLQRAFEAGEVGIPDVLVVQRELIEGQAGFLAVRQELARALSRARASANLPQTGTAQEDTR